MRRVDPDLRCAALVMGLQETRGAQAPLISGFETGKAEFRARRAQVVADIFRIGEEFRGHERADRVAAVILRAGVAMPVAEKPGDRLAGAARQRPAQYIDRFFHLHCASPMSSIFFEDRLEALELWRSHQRIARRLVARILVRGAKRLGFRPVIERLAAVPDNVGGVETVPLALGPLEQAKLAKARNLTEMALTLGPHAFELGLVAGLHLKTVHRDECHVVPFCPRAS